MKCLINYIFNLKLVFFDKKLIGNICLYSTKDSYLITFHFFIKKEFWNDWGMEYIHYDGCYKLFGFGPFFAIAWFRSYTKNCEHHDT